VRNTHHLVEPVVNVGRNSQNFTLAEAIHAPVPDVFVRMVCMRSLIHVVVRAPEGANLESYRIVILTECVTRILNAPHLKPTVRRKRLSVHEINTSFIEPLEQWIFLGAHNPVVVPTKVRKSTFLDLEH